MDEPAIQRTAETGISIANNENGEEIRQERVSAELIRAHSHQCNGQLFDERGHPVNIRSRVFSRSMRRAQNEVLSIVGVCVRDIPKSRHGEANPRSDLSTELVQRTAQENIYGLALLLLGATVQCFCIWWIDSFRDKLLVCSGRFR